MLQALACGVCPSSNCVIQQLLYAWGGGSAACWWLQAQSKLAYCRAVFHAVDPVKLSCVS